MQEVTAAQFLRANEHIVRDLFRYHTGVPAPDAGVKIEHDEVLLVGAGPLLDDALSVAGMYVGERKGETRSEFRWGPFDVTLWTVPMEHTVGYEMHASLIPLFLTLANTWGMGAALARYSMPAPPP